jgi:diamine N-acetyltransferase
MIYADRIRFRAPERQDLPRIYLDVYQNNPRAIRSYQKAGFLHEGTKRQAAYKDGRYIDVLIMSVLRSEWQE